MKKKNLSALFLATVMTALSMLLFVGCRPFWESADDYTEEEHIARVTELARQRYIENGDFTDLEVFPLYDVNDKLAYFLIELQPTGYVYVQLNKEESYVHSLYTMDLHYSAPYSMNFAWFYNTVDRDTATWYTDENGRRWGVDGKRALETNESGEPIIYTDSVFKVAKIHDEKRYLLTVKQSGRNDYIVCVKRGDKYLNLISLEEFEYYPEYEEKILADIPLYFVTKGFNL